MMYTPVHVRFSLDLAWMALLAYGVLAVAASGTMATSGLLPYYIARQLATEGHFELFYTEEVLNKGVDEPPDSRPFPRTPAFEYPRAHAHLYAPISYVLSKRHNACQSYQFRIASWPGGLRLSLDAHGAQTEFGMKSEAN